jgi:hypothetical protein
MAEGNGGFENPMRPKKKILSWLRRPKALHSSSPYIAAPGHDQATDASNTLHDTPPPSTHAPLDVMTQPTQDIPDETNEHENDRFMRAKDGSEVSAHQKGRVIRLADQNNTYNYLIDVTDRVEPNQQKRDPNNPTTVRELYPEFNDEMFNNVRGSNNGIVVTITDRFSPDHQKRIYIAHLGKLVYDDAGKGSFPDISVLEKLKLEDRGHGVYVPWSSNSAEADAFFAKEISEAFSEQTPTDLPALENPNTIDAPFTVK